MVHTRCTRCECITQMFNVGREQTCLGVVPVQSLYQVPCSKGRFEESWFCGLQGSMQVARTRRAHRISCECGLNAVCCQTESQFTTVTNLWVMCSAKSSAFVFYGSIQ
jgi:hypothetical protein